MKTWQTKEISKITHLSVQTLHYYDRIGLLEPTVRRYNNYRVYSQKDLLRLQRIIALKSFGFSLRQIKQILDDDCTLLEQLKKQSAALKAKADNLMIASSNLQQIIENHNLHTEELWPIITETIEVYTMMKQTDYAWAQELLTPAEYKQFVAFETEVKGKEEFANHRQKLIELVENNLTQDPNSETSMEIAAKWMDMVNNLYGPENANLKFKIWNEGFKKGKISGKGKLDPAIIKWLDKAIDHYYRTRLLKILGKIDSGENSNPITEWNEIMLEMFGNSAELKSEFIANAIKDPATSHKMRSWLQSL